MLGEIRDEETADIAVQASLTGHLVLQHAAHQRRARLDHATDQHRRRAVSDQRGGQRDSGTAPGPKNLPAVQGRIHADATKCSEFLHDAGIQVREDIQGQRLRPLPQDRLFRAAGHLRIAGHGRRAARHGDGKSGRDAACGSCAANAGWSRCAKTVFTKVMKGLTTVDEILRVTENSYRRMQVLISNQHSEFSINHEHPQRHPRNAVECQGVGRAHQRRVSRRCSVFTRW